MKRVLRFTAEWCAPCKTMATMLDEINCGIPIEVIDIDKSIETSMEFGIRSVPTLVMMDGNIQMKRMTGMKKKSDLETWLKT